MKLWPCGFRIEYTHLGFASAGAVWLGIWNSDHVVLKSSIRSSASPCSAAVWLGFWNSDHVVLKLSIRSSASPRSAAVWLGFWNSDHVVLKSSIRSSASPRSAAVWIGLWTSKLNETRECDGTDRTDGMDRTEGRKVYVLLVKNVHFGAPSDPSQNAATKTKPRYVYSILKPHGQNFITSPESVQSSCVR